MNKNLKKIFFSFFKTLKRSQYLKDVFISFSGTTLSQVITIGMAPILTRIYSPADYGMLAIYMSITFILSVFVNLQYAQAILLTGDKNEEDNVVGLCYFITSVCSVIIGVIIAISFVLNISFFTNSELSYWIFFIPISIFIGGLNTIHTNVLNKYKSYRGLSVSQVARALSTILFSLFFGLTLKSYEGLLIGLLVGQFTYFITLIFFSRKIRIILNNLSILRIKSVMKKFKKFPIFSIPTEFLYGWTEQLPIYFFNIYSSTTVIGHFNYGKRMVSLPISFITSAVGNVFAQRTSEQYNKTGECKKIFVNTLKMLSLPTLPFFILLAFFAPTIFGFVFGQEWITAGKYVQVLIPMFYLKAIASPLSYMYIIKNKQDEDMVLHIISFVLVALSFYIGYSLNLSIKNILAMFSLSYSIIYITYLCRSYIFATNKVN